MTLTITDPRELIVVTDAIYFAIEALSRLPGEWRPDSNIVELKHIVDASNFASQNTPMQQFRARQLVDVLQGRKPEVPPWLGPDGKPT